MELDLDIIHILEESDECYTPAYFIDPIRELANGFSLDPYSSKLAQDVILADRYLSIEDDALGRNWIDESEESYPTFWINPPYSRKQVRKCVEKALEYIGHAEMYLLVNSQTSSKVYRKCVRECQAFLFPEKRIQFRNPYKNFDNSNNRDQTLFYFGKFQNRFKLLYPLGEIVVKDGSRPLDEY